MIESLVGHYEMYINALDNVFLRILWLLKYEASKQFHQKNVVSLNDSGPTRQKEITRICNSITCLTIAQEKALLPRLLTDLGNANTSQDLLDSVPADFLFLNEIFCQLNTFDKNIFLDLFSNELKLVSSYSLE